MSKDRHGRRNARSFRCHTTPPRPLALSILGSSRLFGGYHPILVCHSTLRCRTVTTAHNPMGDNLSSSVIMEEVEFDDDDEGRGRAVDEETHGYEGSLDHDDDNEETNGEERRPLRRRPAPPAPEETRNPLDRSVTDLSGFQVLKLFDDGHYYSGYVGTEEPKRIRDGNKRYSVWAWWVYYDVDGDCEQMTRADLAHWDARKRSGKNSRVRMVSSSDETSTSDETTGGETTVPPVVVTPSKPSKKAKEPHASYEGAKKDLLWRMGFTEEEVEAALDSMGGPPYELNKAVKIIHDAKVQEKYQNSAKEIQEDGTFLPKVGMRIRQLENGCTYYGKVTKDAESMNYQVDPDADDPNLQPKIKMWEVTWDDDGEKEFMDFEQLLRGRASRPKRHHPVRGRQLSFVELFSGCGRVSQEFCARRWRVRSIDNDPSTYPTDRVDFLKLTFANIGPNIPDCIWMSPPCFTYSNMAGGRHRSPNTEEYEKTPEARLHNTFLTRLNFVMSFVLKYKPHAVFIIENPVGALAKMPLMHQIIQNFGLHRATVHYCALGREDKKPTCLWTNDFELYSRLNFFQCSEATCPYFGKPHPVGARSHGQIYNVAAIPAALAEETAACVDHAFYYRRIPLTTREVVVTDEMIAEFNRGMDDDVDM